MPKVLRIINRFNLGGPTYNASYLTRYMAPDFETLLIGGANEVSEANSEYIPRSLGLEPLIISEMRRTIDPLNDRAAYKKICNVIKEFRPDIVHTHASKAGALGRRAARNLKVPVIVHTFHGHVFDAYFSGAKSRMYRFIERRLARFSDCIIALSDIQKSDLVDKYKICPESKVRVIPLGFDLSRFQESMDQKRIDFREEYFIDNEEIAIGIIGRVVPIKNHKLFLNGIKNLKSHNKHKIRAFIIGDGDERKNIESYAKELELSITDFNLHKIKADVTFTSWMKDVDKVNAGMDIIALTSLNEGTPVSLIEAQASNKPIVSTRVGGIENIVIPGETALLSDANDTETFFANLQILCNNSAMRERFSSKGWEFVRDKFHYTRLIADMKVLYNSLLEQKKSGPRFFTNFAADSPE